MYTCRCAGVFVTWNIPFVWIQVRLQLELLPDSVCVPPRVGEMVRGDSMQSDSSGYADEEVSPSSNKCSYDG